MWDTSILNFSYNSIYTINDDEHENIMLLKEWLDENKLSLNVAKMQSLLIGSRHKISTLEQLAMNSFLQNQIQNIRDCKLQHLLTLEIVQKINTSRIKPYFRYCCSVWGCVGTTYSTEVTKNIKSSSKSSNKQLFWRSF